MKELSFHYGSKMQPGHAGDLFSLFCYHHVDDENLSFYQFGEFSDSKI